MNSSAMILASSSDPLGTSTPENGSAAESPSYGTGGRPNGLYPPWSNSRLSKPRRRLFRQNLYPPGIFFQEGFPRPGLVFWRPLLVIVTHGYRQCISCVEQFRELADCQQCHEHSCNLLFGRIAIAGNGLFYFLRGVFDNGNLPGKGCRHRNTLGTAEF